MATCQPPDVDLDSPVVDQPPPEPDNPAQPDVEDRNFNYVNDAEDPTNQLDADGNITSTPLELWEISETTVNVEGPDGATVAFPYYPYGNDQIDPQQATPEKRSYTIAGTNRTFNYSQYSAIAGFDFNGRTLIPARNARSSQDNILLVANTLTGDIVAHWELDFSFGANSQYPEKHPPLGERWDITKDATASLGTLDPNEFSGLWPFQVPFVGTQDRWQVGEGKIGWPVSFGTRYSYDQFDDPDFATIIQYGDDAKLPGFERFQQVKESVGSAGGVTTRTYPFYDSVYFDVPADWDTGGTLTLKPVFTDTRKIELWAYANKSMPLGLLDSWGFSQEYAVRNGVDQSTTASFPAFPFRGIQKPGAKGSSLRFFTADDINVTRSDGRWLSGRVSFSPSGNRVAVAIPLGNFPQPFYYEATGLNNNQFTKINVDVPADLARYGTQHTAVLIMERADENSAWEPYNIVCDPNFYSSDFGPIQADGSFRVWNGSATPDYRLWSIPVFWFTDENTMTCEWQSRSYARTDVQYYIDSYSINITAGQGDFINGPTVLSSSRRDGQKTAFRTTVTNDKGVVVGRALHPEAVTYENLFYGETLGGSGPRRNAYTKRLYANNKFFEGGNYTDRHAVMIAEEVTYNGFRIVSYPDAPMVPNLSVRYQARSGLPVYPGTLTNDVRSRSGDTRRGFANIGEVAALDSGGNIVKRWQPQDAREWAKFQADDGRITGRPLILTDLQFPEDEVGVSTSYSEVFSEKTIGLMLQFGQKLVLQGSNLWIWQQYYDTGNPVDPDLTYTNQNLASRFFFTPKDSATFWTYEGGGWFVIDLSTIPELNP